MDRISDYSRQAERRALSAPFQASTFVGALTAAALLSVAGSASAESYGTPGGMSAAKSSAILGGATSRLALIAAQQGGGSAAASPAPIPRLQLASNSYTATARTTAAPVRTQQATFQRASYTRSMPSYSRPTVTTTASPDLFGSTAIKVSTTRLDAKWRKVRGNAAPASAGALTRVAYTDRTAQLKRVNSWVNQSVTFSEDRRTYGEADYWANAQETLRRGRGDCEDYAIAKMQILRAAGVSPRDMYLVIAKDLVRRADHALLAVRTENGFVILDSNTDKVMRADEVSDYRPIMTFGSEGTWIHGYSERAPAPVMMVASAEGSAGGSN